MIIKTSADEIQNFLVDASNYSGFCNAVYFPENESEIASILKEANENKTLVTVSGNGTGLTGARVPEGGIVISTEKLNKIIEINKNEMYAVVQPGVILADFQSEVNKLNLLYPPDPTERNCFIGATVATNASGEKTFKYGPTRNFVLGLQLILPNGEMLNLERGEFRALGRRLKLKSEEGTLYNLELPEYEMPKTKNASGYYCQKDMDAIDLFIGSEGTLGVITKIKLKLIPQPEKIFSCVIFFYDESNALSFIQKAREISYENRKANKANEIDALALEFFDLNSLKFLLVDYPNIPSGSKAAVWFEQEANSGNEDMIINKWMELISDLNGDEESAWVALSESDRKKIEEFRHSISAKVNEYISIHHMKKLGTDVAVPDEKFNELYYFCRNEVETAGINYVVYGHFGNSHIHLNMLPKNQDEYLIGKNIYNNICRKTIELKGTISAEHGIGKLKTEYLLQMYGRKNVAAMASLKTTLDQNLILGIGNIIAKEFFI